MIVASARKIIPAVLSVILCVGIGIGFAELYLYANTPSPEAVAHAQWPHESRLERSKSARGTLLVFAHPRCPCSRATLEELETMRADLGDRAHVIVLFVRPKGETNDWAKEELWAQAQALPGVQVVLDEDAREADLFGAKTSGQTLLYDDQGRLVFRGGLTPQRGHAGESLGRDAVLSFFMKGFVPEAKASVFGCSLTNPERAPAAGGLKWKK